jgi:hypothetical protein
MSWVLFAQVLVMMVATVLVLEAAAAFLIDKCREDDIKRKDAGL